MAIEKELLDQLLAGRDPNEVFAKDGLLDDLKKALSERILNAELDEHLDGERVEGRANRRNGHSKKSVLTGTSKMTLSIPRDRARHARRASGGRLVLLDLADEMIERAGDVADRSGGNLRVERRRVELGMSEQHLDHANIDVLLQ